MMDIEEKDVEDIFNRAKRMEDIIHNGNTLNMRGIMVTLFLEPSTRTKLSFQTAAQLCGLGVVDFLPDVSSLKKGESLTDTIKMLDGYADVIVMRHPKEGAARYAADIADCSVINGGDGGNQHPTQTLIDLYTMLKSKGRLEGLEVYITGDLKHARTIRSLLFGLAMFNASITLIAPKGLEIGDYTLKEVNKRFSSNIKQMNTFDLKDADVLYVTRIQEERFADKYEAQRIQKEFSVSVDGLKDAKEDLIILHPLPKLTEIPLEIDNTRYAKYFEQAWNGVPVRMAVIEKVLEG